MHDVTFNADDDFALSKSCHVMWTFNVKAKGGNTIRMRCGRVFSFSGSNLMTWWNWVFTF